MEMENLSSEMTLYEIDQLVVEFFNMLCRGYKNESVHLSYM